MSRTIFSETGKGRPGAAQSKLEPDLPAGGDQKWSDAVRGGVIVDKVAGAEDRPQTQPCSVRWLVAHHAVSAAVAAVIAAELGRGGM